MKTKIALMCLIGLVVIFAYTGFVGGEEQRLTYEQQWESFLLHLQGCMTNIPPEIRQDDALIACFNIIVPANVAYDIEYGVIPPEPVPLSGVS